MGIFFVNKEIYQQKCVVCKIDLKSSQVNNVLFSNCFFEIEGVINDGKKIHKPKKSTGKNKYISFEDEGPQDL